MKQPSQVARLAGAGPGRRVRLTAGDWRQVRTIAVTAHVRTARRKALLFSGRHAGAAAEALAKRLGDEIFHVDLSAVVSQYIGETEKNLRRLFDAAVTSGAILFFDEADALFGKRSEVKDSHDRYANIEAAYLLQRIGEFKGPVILSARFKHDLDPAFTRRLHFAFSVSL